MKTHDQVIEELNRRIARIEIALSQARRNSAWTESIRLRSALDVLDAFKAWLKGAPAPTKHEPVTSLET